MQKISTLIISLLFFSTFISCRNNSYITSSSYKKKIHLKEFIDSRKIILNNDSAQILFSLNEVNNFIYSEVKNSKTSRSYLELSNLISKQSGDIVLPLLESNFAVDSEYLSEMYWIAFNLLKKGKAQVYSKVLKENIKVLTSAYLNDPYAGKQTHFLINNGSIIFSYVFSLGD